MDFWIVRRHSSGSISRLHNSVDCSLTCQTLSRSCSCSCLCDCDYPYVHSLNYHLCWGKFSKLFACFLRFPTQMDDVSCRQIWLIVQGTFAHLLTHSLDVCDVYGAMQHMCVCVCTCIVAFSTSTFALFSFQPVPKHIYVKHL